jgi:tetratricopeptide (TPR) repeat protein
LRGATEKQKVRDLALLGVIVLGLAGVFLLSRAIDARRPAPDTKLEEERLYFSANTARRLSLGFDGLMADWYWMRSLQYVGHKIMNVPDNVPIDDLGALNLKLLAPLLDTATTLDPQFMEPYTYSAVVLPAVNVDEAIRITQKGISANPDSWLLYHHLGYIYWQRGEFQKASELYGAGAATSDAPPWMEAMKARMAAEGGSRATAREIYTRMSEGSTDEQVKEMARRRLMQLDSLDQRDTLRRLLTAYKNRSGHCLSAWKDVTGALQTLRVATDTDGAPVDPSGFAYRLVKGGCDVDLDPKSEVPAR